MHYPGIQLARLCMLLVLFLICTHVNAGSRITLQPSVSKSSIHSPVSTTGTIRGLDNPRATMDGHIIVPGHISGQGHIQADHVVFEGTVSPGNSPGCITMGGNATFSSTAVLVMEIGGLVPCSEHDQLSVANDLVINASRLELVLINGFLPQEGQRFDLLDWGTFSGAFGSIDSSNSVLPAHLVWDFSQLDVTGEVVVDLLADGDLNSDGIVNVIDVLLSLQALSGKIILTQTQLEHGDVAPVINGIPVPDGNFTLGDMLVIQRKALGN